MALESSIHHEKKMDVTSWKDYILCPKRIWTKLLNVMGSRDVQGLKKLAKFRFD